LAIMVSPGVEMLLHEYASCDHHGDQRGFYVQKDMTA
jgi:hypothetical protein